MAQSTIYSPREEQELMTTLWSDDIANDPEKFVLFAFPWGQKGTPLEHFKGPRLWQREVLRELKSSIDTNSGKVDFDAFRMAVSSGRGIGKSALVSWLVLWMLTTRIGSSAIVSANSESQLKSVTWGELSKWSAMLLNAHWWEITATSLLPAKWLSDIVERDLKMGTRYWGAIGKLWSEENPDSYAGVHNHSGMLLIFDEASGIPDSIWSVAAGFFTENTPNRFWFAFSNPRRNKGYFFEAFNSKRSFWRNKQIDSRTVEGTDKALYQAIIDEYGEDSPQAKVEVYGQFPSDDDESFISTHIIDEAIKRDNYRDDTAPTIIGVDPARSGSDSTVIVVRKGRDIISLKRYKGCDTMETVGNVIVAIEEYNPDLVVIDEGGIGAGVLDRLKEQRYRCVRGVNFAWKSSRPAAYVNKRAEMWGLMKEWLKTASIPDDKLLRSDLSGPKVKPTSSGAIQLESKAQMKSRGLASPDAADAICVTFAYNVASKEVTALKRAARNGNGGYSSPNHGASWMGT